MSVLKSNYLTRLSLAVVLMACSFLIAGSVSAADTISTSVFIDADGDGQVDHAKLTFDANIATCVYEAGDWTVDTAGTIAVTAVTGISTDNPEGSGDGACDSSDAVIYVDIATTADITGGATAPEITYTNQGNANDLTDSGNITTKADISLADAAAPTFVSTVPASAATSVGKNDSIVITFSEPMVTDFVEDTEFTILPDPGGFNAAVFSVGNTVVTLDPPTFACGVDYVFTSVDAQIAASAGTPTGIITTGTHDGDWTFTTIGSTCSQTEVPASGSSDTDDEEEEVESYEVTLSDISDASPGDFYTIEWTASDNFTMVDLWYSEDDGATYVQIADNTNNDGSHKWTIPSDIVEDFMIKIEATDLVTVLASDTVSVSGDDEEVVDEEEDDSDDEEEEVVDEEEGEEDDEAAPAWDVDGVEAGDVIRGETLSSLYYITEDYERRAFVSEAVYFTWYDDFDNVETISDDDLAAFTLGGLMLPQSGTVLVKIQSDPSVYALGEGDDMYMPVLQYIDSEETAIDLWGDDWADYVIDVESTFIAYFETGDDVDAHFVVDMDKMKKRVDLHS
jgi:hypothetical protein